MHDPGYETFLTRLKVHERIEPAALPRTPEKLLSMRLLLEALGHPERAYRVIHVAGTNGKGLTSAMIAELLRLEGHSVGLYTSPHVLDLRERIQVDGAMVTPGVFSEVGMRVLDLAEPLRAHYTVSYFDLLTAMALEVFRTRQVTWVVLETGLGGRADATNAVDKDCAVLTRIGLDHQAVLGATLREIAWEKLGIARPGVPTILAGQPPELGEWMSAELRRLGSPVVDTAGYGLEERFATGGIREPRVWVTWPGGVQFPVELPLASPPLTVPRIACAVNALATGDSLLGAVNPAADEARRAAWVRAVVSVTLPGRLELRRNVRLRGTPGPRLARVVLDGGHNADALEALAEQLKSWALEGYTLLLSLQGDKLVEAVRGPLARLLAGAERLLLLAPNSPRAPSPEQFARFLTHLPGHQGSWPAPERMTHPEAALRAALETPERPLVACGSFWMLGDLMPLLVCDEEEAPLGAA